MALTEVNQVREAIVVSGALRHDVTTTIVDKGDLPDFGAFLMEIIEEDDPKRDVLARVVGVGDYSEYGTNRLAAVNSRALYYRTGALLVSYDDLVDANNASLQLKDELNKLVEDYQTFLTEFDSGTGGETFFLPEPDLGLLTPLVEQYNETVTLRIDQQETVDEKTAECADASNDVTEANTKVTIYQDSLDALNEALAVLNSASAALTNTAQTRNNVISTEIKGTLDEWAIQRIPIGAGAPRDAMDAFLLATSGSLYDEYNVNWLPAQTQLALEIAVVDAQIAPPNLTTTIATFTSALGQAQTDAGLAQTTSDECQVELSEAQAVLAELQQREAILLAEIVALCPTFEPTTN